MNNTTFNAQVFQNQFLPAGATEVHAIMTVNAATGTGSHLSTSERGGSVLVLGIILDCSGSMGENDNERLRNAKDAVQQAIKMLRADCQFFVIAGYDRTSVIVPLCHATESNKRDAVQRVGHLESGGTTCMSKWLSAALEQFPKGPQYIRQALLLTDGKNDAGDSQRLPEVLDQCEDVFQCDARGVGVDWHPEQLRLISGKLLGTTDIIAKPQDLADDFKTIIERALGMAVSDVCVRLWTPLGATVRYCKQVSPEIVDLTAKARINPQTPQFRDFPTGAWGHETRDYHFSIQTKAGAVGQKMLAGRASLILRGPNGEVKAAEAQILAIWTDDDAQSAVIDRRVAHYTGQGELAQAIQEGLEARREGDDAAATRKLGRAVQLAAESGNDATTKLLRKVVDVIDEDKGTVKLKRNVEDADEMALDTRSTKTRRVTV